MGKIGGVHVGCKKSGGKEEVKSAKVVRYKYPGNHRLKDTAERWRAVVVMLLNREEAKEFPLAYLHNIKRRGCELGRWLKQVNKRRRRMRGRRKRADRQPSQVNR